MAPCCGYETERLGLEDPSKKSQTFTPLEGGGGAKIHICIHVHQNIAASQ